MSSSAVHGSPVANPLSKRVLPEDVLQALHRGLEGLLAQQRSDGHWVGELQGDTILESEFILLLAILGHRNDSRIPLLANYLLAQQQEDGGWSNYPGGPSEVSTSVKAYFALKIAGHSADAPSMRRAKDTIRRLGGAEASNSFTRFYLAMLGQVPYVACPTVPAELILLPRWFPINIYAMSSWSRTIFVPLSVVDAFKPVTRLPEELHIRELFLEAPETPRWPARPTKALMSWTNFFLGVDWVLKKLERYRLLPWRKRAVERAVGWMRERFKDSDGLGAIFPPMIYTCLVLKCLGVPESDPEFRWALKQLDDLQIFEGDTLRLQPCVSPVWDTALSVIAAVDAGERGNSTHLDRAVNWLLQREVRRAGDWSVTVPGVEPGGWAFEYANAFYPDTDDTSMVLIALARTGRHVSPTAQAAVHRAVQWLVAMQNSDGGWAAFDRNIDNEILTRVPFADHNAMLDPSCPDITARVLEALSHYGFRVGQGNVDRAIAFIAQRQEANGSWFGRWGVNYIYGTWQVLVGLKAIGYDMTLPMVRRAVRWLKEVQNPDGGWGESCRSYDDPSQAGQGESTASQTAWALLGLLAAGEQQSPEVQAGINYLLATQLSDGTWDEEPFTGTGFPRVFYLKYHMYAHYFPLMALGRYIQASQSRSSERMRSGYRYDPGHVISPTATYTPMPRDPQAARN